MKKTCRRRIRRVVRNIAAICFITAALFEAAAVRGSGAEQPRYWVFFSDKNAAALSKANKSALYQRQFVSERSLARRRKTLPRDMLILEGDIPVNGDYLGGLERRGFKPEVISRWLNAVSLELTGDEVNTIKSLPYVSGVEPVGVFIREVIQPPAETADKPVIPAGDIEYGLSASQAGMINVPDLHRLGITGDGILIGMMDSGFNLNHEALTETEVVAEWDFINSDGNTANEAGDPALQDKHGSQTLAVIAGLLENQLIGSAFGASFALAKTEVRDREISIEEDNWVAGIEWLDSVGVDVVSSSLGYANDFIDRPDYTYSQMDGRTTITTIAAQAAFERGIVVVNSVGNERMTSWKYLIAPADAPGVLAVGAVDYGGVITDFSSPGPTADGRIKPDCVGPGSGVYSVGFSLGGVIIYNAYSLVSGTSFSAPLVAGAAALVLASHPELTPAQVLEAVRNTADRSDSPDNNYGYGLVNAFEAALYYGPVFGAEPYVEEAGTDYKVSVSAAGSGGIASGEVKIHYRFNMGAQAFQTVVMEAGTETASYTALIPAVSLLSDSVQYYFTALDSSGTFSRWPKGTTTFGKPLIDKIPEDFDIVDNFPNPFNAYTRIVVMLPDESFLKVKIYNVLGKEIRNLATGSYSPGKHFLVWDGRNNQGVQVATGVYFCRVQSSGYARTIKMLYLK